MSAIQNEASPFQPPADRRKRQLLTGAAVALVLLALVVAFVATRGGSTPVEDAAHDHATMGASTSGPGLVTLDAAQAERIGVTYAAVELTPIARTVRTVGQVTFDETRLKTISPRVDGWIEQLYVNATGQYVGRGQALFTLYSPMLVSAQEELLLAKRLSGEVSGGTSDGVLGADQLLASARRRLQYWEVPADEIARIERSGEVRRTITMRSPVSGYVVDKPVLAGQRIMSGDAIYRIADLSVVWVEGEVFERDLASVRLGQVVTAHFEALPGESRTGRITYVHPTLNPETRTVRVRVELTNRDQRLKPGMYATLTMPVNGGSSALTVPRGAVLSTGERNLVFVRRADGKLEPRLVTLGSTGDARIEILAGLVAGETVVASATFLVDAESNLGTLMGGMGDMPGMDMTAPTTGPAPTAAPAPTAPAVPAPVSPVPPAVSAPPQSHDGH
ncbi:MAG TPA: efflux RND transporter periplasmic adaptor subunit [Gemmatimonadaceae bacterium]